MSASQHSVLLYTKLQQRTHEAERKVRPSMAVPSTRMPLRFSISQKNMHSTACGKYPISFNDDLLAEIPQYSSFSVPVEKTVRKCSGPFFPLPGE